MSLRRWWSRLWHRVDPERDERKRAAQIAGEREVRKALRAAYESQARLFQAIIVARIEVEKRRMEAEYMAHQQAIERLRRLR